MHPVAAYLPQVQEHTQANEHQPKLLLSENFSVDLCRLQRKNAAERQQDGPGWTTSSAVRSVRAFSMGDNGRLFVQRL